MRISPDRGKGQALKGDKKTKRSSAPHRVRLAVSHGTFCLPLLPSGPGGVQQRPVAQDLTSLCCPRTRRQETLPTRNPSAAKRSRPLFMLKVELRGLEPPTFRMRTERSPIELQPRLITNCRKICFQYRKKCKESQSIGRT
jgi:hypothetical protein